MTKKQKVEVLSGALQKAHLTLAGGENYERFSSVWSLSQSIFPIKSQELGESKPVRFLVSDQIPAENNEVSAEVDLVHSAQSWHLDIIILGSSNGN